MKQLNLSQYLRKRSKEICADNKCTEDNHNCESYAYINAHLQLLDICISDYFQGSSKPHAAIPLPWNGNMIELKEAVIEQVYEDVKMEGARECETFSGQNQRYNNPYKGELARYWNEGWNEHAIIKGWKKIKQKNNESIQS